MTTGILLVNLGTPDSPEPRDVKRYLNEFLTDGRVIDMAPIPRHLLVRGMIVPRRHKESAKAYRKIWTEAGSPLLVHGKRVRDLLQEELGERFQVELAMRYQSPSIASALERLQGASSIVVIPLFPQYASATTGSVHQRVMEVISKWQTIPDIRLVNSYPTQALMIAAFAERARAFDLESYDHILMSFHGLPERHIRKADRTGQCLTPGCCERKVPCYRAQCIATARAIAAELGLEPDQYSVAFQSRLGKDPWLQPYTSDVVQKFKNLLVLCPAFVADCLETLYEIREEYGQELVPSLNDHPLWIKALTHLATFDNKTEKVYTS